MQLMEELNAHAIEKKLGANESCVVQRDIFLFQCMNAYESFA